MINNVNSKVVLRKELVCLVTQPSHRWQGQDQLNKQQELCVDADELPEERFRPRLLEEGEAEQVDWVQQCEDARAEEAGDHH